MEALANIIKLPHIYVACKGVAAASNLRSKVVQPGGRRFGAMVGTWGASSAPATYHHCTANYEEVSNQSVIQNFIN